MPPRASDGSVNENWIHSCAIVPQDGAQIRYGDEFAVYAAIVWVNPESTTYVFDWHLSAGPDMTIGEPQTVRLDPGEAARSTVSETGLSSAQFNASGFDLRPTIESYISEGTPSGGGGTVQPLATRDDGDNETSTAASGLFLAAPQTQTQSRSRGRSPSAPTTKDGCGCGCGGGCGGC